jgi:tripartite-type tricarboxylate transporter receptor subunit TctC
MILRGIIALVALATAASANDLKIVTHTSTGGFTIHARVFAQHLQKYIPGQTVSIKIVPGAAGIAAANYLYNVAPKDGSEIGTINTKVLTQGLIKNDEVKYDLSKFGWLGSSIDGRKEPFVLWAKAGPDQLIAGSEGGFAINHIKLVNSVLRWNMREVVGYAESGQVRMAFEKGEINLVAYNLTGIRTTAPAWLKDSSVLPMVQYGAGLARHPDLPFVPTVKEFAVSESDRQIISTFERLLVLGRAFAGPPGIPDHRLVQLRVLFERTFNDPEYRKEAAKIGVIASPVSWREAEEIVKDILRTSPDTVSRFKKF